MPSEIPAQTIHPIDPNTKRFTSGWYTWVQSVATQLGSGVTSPAIVDEDFSSDGLMTRTASGTYASRTLTGTADKITIINGDGDAGNPTITIASTYAGQATITTVGTITSGTWTGTAVAVANGGTGSTSASDARTALGLAIGTNVQAYDADLSAIAALADPNNDRILFWDDSAGAYAYLTAGTGLTITDTTINGSATPAEITSASASGPTIFALSEDTDNGANKVSLTVASSLASDYVVTLPAATGTLLTSTEIAAAYQPLDADLTTIAGLVDPNADRLLFWDDSAGAYAYLAAGSGLTITDTTITASAGTTTTEVTGTSANMAVNSKYIANNGSMVTLTLPATAALGDVFYILGKGAGLFTIAEASGQTINFGSVAATTTTGTIVATNRYDCLTIECITADTVFVVSSSQGTFTIT